MAIDDDLTVHLNKIGAAPFLFIGSGLSRRYIGLEDWNGLLQKFADGLKYRFEYYRSSSDGNLSATAKTIADEFFNYWWNDEKFSDSRELYGSDITETTSPLKFEISKYISKTKYKFGSNSQHDKEIESLKKATIDGIITTNWDTFLESLFPDFETYIGQGQILFANPQGIAEIYKIHGCVTEPNSLILTTSDYAEFNKRNAYLAAKLLTIFVEHPVIFLGYSLSDDNIRELLLQIASCLTDKNINKLRDRLIFIERDRDNSGESFYNSVMQMNSYTLPVTVIRTNDFCKIFDPLNKIKRRFPARLLRKMKEHVYELVKNNDPKGKLAVMDINSADHFNELEVVYGVGIQSHIGVSGYTPISRIDLLKDIMAETSQYDAKLIVTGSLPELLKSTKYVPIFRYLSQGGLIKPDKSIETNGLDSKVKKACKIQNDSFHPPKNYLSKMAEVRKKCKSVEDVVKHYDQNALFFIPLLQANQIKLEDLRKFILSNMDLVSSKKKPNHNTYFCKLICYYDWLKYGR